MGAQEAPGSGLSAGDSQGGPACPGGPATLGPSGPHGRGGEVLWLLIAAQGCFLSWGRTRDFPPPPPSQSPLSHPWASEGISLGVLVSGQHCRPSPPWLLRPLGHPVCGRQHKAGIGSLTGWRPHASRAVAYGGGRLGLRPPPPCLALSLTSTLGCRNPILQTKDSSEDASLSSSSLRRRTPEPRPSSAPPQESRGSPGTS